jgi:hypothetical protein
MGFGDMAPGAPSPEEGVLSLAEEVVCMVHLVTSDGRFGLQVSRAAWRMSVVSCVPTRAGQYRVPADRSRRQ